MNKILFKLNRLATRGEDFRCVAYDLSIVIRSRSRTCSTAAPVSSILLAPPRKWEVTYWRTVRALVRRGTTRTYTYGYYESNDRSRPMKNLGAINSRPHHASASYRSLGCVLHLPPTITHILGAHARTHACRSIIIHRTYGPGLLVWQFAIPNAMPYVAGEKLSQSDMDAPPLVYDEQARPVHGPCKR